ncbi:hypothetical protein HJC23_008865 [Cyclotella cryptica]|uniref:Uncharacterized protein n=1 Tax=Cyclotella cryptica TaxID=29204 RepID=A0ABD3P614_9STRA|eukprot:CCRYP_017628-RA/>CCRYP_017628-RA protein AED:0.14 eAED:0.14 QI:0/-1/0/1/-1/1/1/0/631
MKNKAIIPLPLLFVALHLTASSAAAAAVQTRVLRGQRSLHLDPTRLFRKGPKSKKSDDDIDTSKLSPPGSGNDKLSAGSSGSVNGATPSSTNNAVKCKAKMVKVPVAGTAAAVGATTSTSSTVTSFGATEGISGVQPQTRGKTKGSDDATNVDFELVRQDICDENGNLIPPNTFWPTVSPGGEGTAAADIVDTVETGAPTVSPPTSMDDDGGVPTSSPIGSGLAFQSDDSDADDDDDTSRTNSPGCSAFDSNQVYVTSLSARVSFVYEISTDSTYNVSSIVNQLDQKTARLVGSDLIHCELLRTRARRNQRRLESNVDGIDPLPLDVPTDASCTYFNSTDASMSCTTIQGQMTLYLRQNSAESSALESSSRALKILMQNLNMENSPFLAASQNDQYSVDGVLGIRYISGTPDQQIYIDNNGNGDTLNAGGATEETENQAQEVKNLSGLGIALVSVGSVLLLTLLLVATTRNKRGGEGQETYAEFFDDDNDLDKQWDTNEDDDVSHGGTMESSSSVGSPNAEPMARVYHEEDSIYTDCNTSTIIKELHASEAAAAAHGIGDDRSLSPKRPIFLSAYDENSIAGESVEHLYDPNRSIYTQNSNISKPTFDNPSGLGRKMENRRHYTVDNTVEL